MILKNFLTIVKASWVQITGISILISFLSTILHGFVFGAVGMTKLSQSFTDKLGVYFYIKEAEKVNITNEVIQFRDKLSKASISSEFVPKEQAWQNIQRKNPEIVDTFKKYGLDNPLPNTLYVTFNNQEKYEKLKAISAEYKHIILNLEDISGVSYAEQENRAKNIIFLTNFVVGAMYFLIATITIVIIYFLLIAMRITFLSFQPQIEVEKLVGASYRQIKFPFFLQILSMLVIGRGLASLYLLLIARFLHGAINKVFSIDVNTIIASNSGLINTTLFVELGLLIISAYLMGNYLLTRMINKI